MRKHKSEYRLSVPDDEDVQAVTSKAILKKSKSANLGIGISVEEPFELEQLPGLKARGLSVPKPASINISESAQSRLRWLTKGIFAVFVAMFCQMVYLERQQSVLLQAIREKWDADGDHRMSKVEVMTWLNENRSISERLTDDQFDIQFGDIDDEGDNFFQLDEIEDIVDQLSEYNPGRLSMEQMKNIKQLADDDNSTLYMTGALLVLMFGFIRALNTEVDAAAAQLQGLQHSIMSSGDMLKKKEREYDTLSERANALRRANSAGAEKQQELLRVSAELEEKAREKDELQAHWQDERKCLQASVESLMDQDQRLQELKKYLKLGKDTFSGKAQLGFAVHGGTTFGSLGKKVEIYRDVGKLGEGSQGTRVCKNISTEKKHCFKMYEIKNKAKKNEIMSELLASQRLAPNPHVMRYDGVIETEDYIFILMELIEATNKGEIVEDLFDYITADPQHYFSEEHVKLIFRQLLLAVKHCHSLDIIHGDLKPENAMVILPRKGGEPLLKLIDFGCSIVGEDSVATSSRDDYAPPEVFYDNQLPKKSTDLYRLGVTLFLLLMKHSPFVNNGAESRQKSILEKRFRWKKLTPEAQRLIEYMMNHDPERRPQTCEEVLKDPWMTSGK